MFGGWLVDDAGMLFGTPVVDFIGDFGLKTSVIKSHKSRHGIPSVRRHASNAMISASDEECETAPCFLQSHVMGAKVLGPMTHKNPPVVDFESLRSPANPASANIASWQSWGSSPTKECMTW